MGSVWSARPAAKMKNEINYNLLPGRVGFALERQSQSESQGPDAWEKALKPGTLEEKFEFGFSTAGYTNPLQAGQDPEEEKSMVTGDLNAALVEWVVQYRIEDPRQYLFDVRNPEEPFGIYPRPQCVR